jgi:hypothetical protein
MAKGDQQRVQERPGAHAYRRGYWYIAGDETMLVAAGSNVGINTLRLYPFRLRSLVQIAQLGTRITTGISTGLVQLAIYPASKRTLQPEGLPLATTGDLDGSAAANVAGTVVGGPVLLPRGVYWGAWIASITGIIGQFGGASSSALGALVGASTQDFLTNGATSSSFLRAVAGSYGVWPDLSRTSMIETSGNSYTLLQFQVAP